MSCLLSEALLSQLHTFGLSISSCLLGVLIWLLCSWCFRGDELCVRPLQIQGPGGTFHNRASEHSRFSETSVSLWMAESFPFFILDHECWTWPYMGCLSRCPEHIQAYSCLLSAFVFPQISSSATSLFTHSQGQAKVNGVTFILMS